MASWMLRCVNCKALFVHSPIADVHISDYFLPAKPEFPAGGSESKCPICGHVGLYNFIDLTYRA
jgi:hypothetical protein